MSHSGIMRSRPIWFGLGLALLLSACAQLPTGAPSDAGDGDRFALPNDPKAKLWKGVPIRTKIPTTYSQARVDGQDCIRAHAKSAWAFKVALVPETFSQSQHLSWQWHVPALIAAANNTVAATDDSPARVVVAFRGDRKQLAATERATMTLAKALSGLEMPYASIQYIWANYSAPETIIPNFFSGRIKKLVVQQGAGALNQWLRFERDLKADFERAYPGETYAGIESIALMTDTDSVGGEAEACYANVVLQR